MNEWFCTVFPNDIDEMPQDFESYVEANKYGAEMFGKTIIPLKVLVNNTHPGYKCKGELIINV